MFTTSIETLNIFSGNPKLKDRKYTCLTDRDFCEKLKTLASPLKIKGIKKWNNNSYRLITPLYKGESAILFLTQVNNLNFTFLHLSNLNKFYVANFRFAPDLYNKNIVIYGDLMPDGKFQTHISKIGEEQVHKELQKLDQLLYSKIMEDTDLEPIQIKIKPFFKSIDDVTPLENVRGFLILNPVIEEQHLVQVI